MTESIALTIRPARLVDARPMAVCIVDTWLAAHRGQMPDRLWERRRATWTYDSSASGWERLLTEIDREAGHPTTVLVAEPSGPTERAGPAGPGRDRGHVVGLGVITRTSEPHRATVDAVYVATDHQGLGVGRHLVRGLAGSVADDGIEAIDVIVLADNAPARRFYEALGAVAVGDGTFDEAGVGLATVVYRWQIGRLVG